MDNYNLASLPDGNECSRFSKKPYSFFRLYLFGCVLDDCVMI